MGRRKENIYCADFETTAEANLKIDGRVRVWLWSFVNVETGEERYGYDLDSFMSTLYLADKVYFHNLKFDGKFILYWLNEKGFIYQQDYSCIIDDMNNWYEIKLIQGDHVIRIWDSLKKFPGLSVNAVAKMFGIEGKKEKPYFDIYRPPDYIPTPEEVEYCLQDSRIIAYAILKELERGHTRMTLSSDAFNEVKNTIGGYFGWRKEMPILGEYYEKFVRKSYKGGYVYVAPKYQNKVLHNVTVYDVNSLYPYVMHDLELPYGNPIPRRPKGGELCVMKFDAEFFLNEGMLPTVQIKHNPSYRETEYLTESHGITEDIYMTNIDYELFKEHYTITYMSEPTYVSFRKKVGLLADYIDKWTEVKIQAKENGWVDVYWQAKRWLNSPYGKTGMNPDRISKVPKMDEFGNMYYDVAREQTEPVYVPYASFVCAQARNITIRSAQSEYDNFVYADTDSLHLLGDQHGELDVHQTALGKWKNEGTYEWGKYIRPKTYIHAHADGTVTDYRISNEDSVLEELPMEVLNTLTIDEIKCAGMTDEVKTNLKWEDFYAGKEFGRVKLLQVSCKGGCYLRPTSYRIKATL